MNRQTPIEDLIDLDDLTGFQPQSLDGHPPRIHPNYQRQMNSELSDRDAVASPLKGKVRHHTDMRNASNAGMPYGNAGMPHGNAGMPYGGGGMPYGGGGMHHGGGGMHHGGGMPHGGGGMPHDYYPLGPPVSYSPRGNDPRGNAPLDHGMIEYMGSGSQGYSGELTCIQVANHIRQCPICSKFYDTDKSVYIVVIVILVVMVMILLKRVLEK